MASKSYEAARLAEAHRLAQARLGARTVALVMASWPLLDPARLDDTVAGWLKVTVPLVQRQRALSTILSANYVSVARMLELGAPFAPVLAGPAPLPALVTSLTVCGPVSIKAAMTRGLSLEAAAENALVRVSGAAERNALDGGRETIVKTTRADPRARGWRRVVSGSACPWCSSLADSEAMTDFESHDHCSCSSAPAYA